MEKPRNLLAGLVVLGAAGVASAQTSGPAPAVRQYSDPFVQCREEKTQAAKEYKAGNISRDEYDRRRAEASEKLKASGERGIFERNLEVWGRGGSWRYGK